MAGCVEAVVCVFLQILSNISIESVLIGVLFEVKLAQERSVVVAFDFLRLG